MRCVTNKIGLDWIGVVASPTSPLLVMPLSLSYMIDERKLLFYRKLFVSNNVLLRTDVCDWCILRLRFSLQ